MTDGENFKKFMGIFLFIACGFGVYFAITNQLQTSVAVIGCILLVKLLY